MMFSLSLVNLSQSQSSLRLRFTILDYGAQITTNYPQESCAILMQQLNTALNLLPSSLGTVGYAHESSMIDLITLILIFGRLADFFSSKFTEFADIIPHLLSKLLEILWMISHGNIVITPIIAHLCENVFGTLSMFADLSRKLLLQSNQGSKHLDFIENIVGVSLSASTLINFPILVENSTNYLALLSTSTPIDFLDLKPVHDNLNNFHGMGRQMNDASRGHFYRFLSNAFLMIPKVHLIPSEVLSDRSNMLKLFLEPILLPMYKIDSMNELNDYEMTYSLSCLDSFCSGTANLQLKYREVAFGAIKEIISNFHWLLKASLGKRGL